jgi:hypothetical protein
VTAPECRETDASVQAELAHNAQADQRERSERLYDGLAERDALRLAYANEQIQAGRICTADDARHAAVVLQHSLVTADHKQAWRLSRWSCDQGLTEACAWVTLAWDRALVSAGEAQWFGSQWVAKPDTSGVMCLVAVDPAATDTDRAAAGFRSLSETLVRSWTINNLAPPPEPTVADLVNAGLVCPPVRWTE